MATAPTSAAERQMKLKAVAQSVCFSGRRTDLLGETARNIELTRWLWDQFEKREVELHRRLELLTRESVEKRVLHTVADLADRSKLASPGLPMPLAQNEIAELAGATRETTSTLLNRLKRRGALELGRRRIQVAAPDVLRGISGISEGESEEATD
jgi:CRP-like cAMP-binding protein